MSHFAINAPPAPPAPKVVEIFKEVDRLSPKQIATVSDKILAEIGAASMVARQEKRSFGTRDIRPIIERNLIEGVMR